MALAMSAAIVVLASALTTPPVARVTVVETSLHPDGSTYVMQNVYRLVAEDKMTVRISPSAASDGQVCMPMVETLVVGP